MKFTTSCVSDGNGNPIAEQRVARDYNEQHDRVEVKFEFQLNLQTRARQKTTKT